MPELGNMMFGHSFGEYYIDNREEMEEVFQPLFTHFKLDNYGHTNKGIVDDTNISLDTELFTIRPYYWGDDENICELPNFVYKPINLEIRWYKYPFRDSYANQQLTVEQYKDIIKKCCTASLVHKERK